jgi:hypothetical protein
MDLSARILQYRRLSPHTSQNSRLLVGSGRGYGYQNAPDQLPRGLVGDIDLNHGVLINDM